ncbi:MAG: HPF/RaiA family ribosome-associated protein [Myxococcales bacterium]|nr:HPF/RaiA family ribosome-associated protein [Myxococcales bacterium]MDH5307844.1 HPF/RaiA family ribosome-associated protein [Myxococcales bacterium]MDH5567648.1 HPF/RaiA family ribosome-associated protein [Myxococcales bacterium]
MVKSPSVVIHAKDAEVEKRTRTSIEKRCERMAEEFPELDQIEITINGDGVGFAVSGHAIGKNTDIATHASASDPGPAADQVLDKIERQLRKVHDKRIFSQRRLAQKAPPKRNLES